MKYLFSLGILVLLSVHGFNQSLPHSNSGSHADSLRGSITEERAWWDLQHYELSVQVNPEKQKIKGKNTISYLVVDSNRRLQIDLQDPLKIKWIKQNGKKLKYDKDGFAYFVHLQEQQQIGQSYQVQIKYSGKPRKAKMAPWDGGFSWEKDLNDEHFIATSCQGLGASVWWPCKDHMYDEPDSGMIIHSIVPKGLTSVSNGRLIQQSEKGNKSKFTWQVVSPINNYGVNLNIGDYIHFSEKYDGEKGLLDMDYWVLKPNLEIAKVQFKDAWRTMQAFEHWFGPYPFYEDGYKLVEVPYLGMEHQSSVTYGNGFKNGYMGRDLSGTGWGKKFDFIIVHESGHEWFANNITYQDIADMWLHESFTCYSEALFLEYHYGKKAAEEYIQGIRKNIANKEAMISKYGINESPTSDVYYKGSNMLHTLRQVLGNDVKWRELLRSLNKDFYHQTVTSDQVEKYMANFLDLKLDYFFDQYLRDNRIPTFEYYIEDGSLFYRWNDCIEGFNMPIKVVLSDEEKVIKQFSNNAYTSIPIKSGVSSIELNSNYYVNIKKMK